MKNVSAVTIYLIAGAIAIITFVVYLPALHNNLVSWDDGDYVYHNSHIRSLDFTFMKWAFLDFHALNWHPLTWISHALDYAVWELNPLGHHLTSIILHGANTFIVVLLIARLLTIAKKSSGDEFASQWLTQKRIWITSAITAVLFGLHPLHVESVAWVSERKDVLCAFFFLLCILAYVRYAEKADTTDRAIVRIFSKRYLLALGVFILALLSKPMAVTLPIVLLILDWYPLERFNSLRTFKDVALEKIPFYLLSLGSSMITLLAQGLGDTPVWAPYPSISQRVIVAADALFRYLSNMILPVHLMPFYPYPHDMPFLSLPSLLPISFIIALTLGCLIISRRQKLWLVLWGYYLVTLLPVIGLIQVGFQSRADRYTYLPSLGPFLAAGLIVTWSWEKVNHFPREGKFIKALGLVAAFGLLLLMTFLTVKQIAIWKNSLTLWTYEVETLPEAHPLVYYNRGTVYHDNNQFDKAMDDYNRAIALKPDYDRAYYDRASIYDAMGQYETAIKDYTTILALKPHFKIYMKRGFDYASSGLLEQAIQDFTKTIDLNQNYDKAYVQRGTAFLKMGNARRAYSDFQIGCRLGNEDACGVLRDMQESVKIREK